MAESKISCLFQPPVGRHTPTLLTDAYPPHSMHLFLWKNFLQNYDSFSRTIHASPQSVMIFTVSRRRKRMMAWSLDRWIEWRQSSTDGGRVNWSIEINRRRSVMTTAWSKYCLYFSEITWNGINGPVRETDHPIFGKKLPEKETFREEVIIWVRCQLCTVAQLQNEVFMSAWKKKHCNYFIELIKENVLLWFIWNGKCLTFVKAGQGLQGLPLSQKH